VRHLIATCRLPASQSRVHNRTFQNSFPWFPNSAFYTLLASNADALLVPVAIVHVHN
jgi:hypothetical protein